MAKNFLLILFIVVACTSENDPKIINSDSISMNDTSTVDPTIINHGQKPSPPPTQKPAPKVYSNERFRDVTVEQIGDYKFRIRGRGQIFEAAFSWVVEDGHNEIKEGFEMTDAGAPEWGNFDFVVDVKKQRPNSTLHLILFESSAKDGSRQYLLPVLLY